MVVGGEEKILVSVRVRPLNEKEKTKNDRCDWECINDTTIICKFHNLHDKSSYTFDRVFGFECPTKKVYDDGAKEVALCVLSGINSSIFAYGQTSSGKTYTMSGITEFAVDDIFDYIDKHKKEKKFTLKFSALEIYNEAVRDLLCEDNNNPLRLLDDPERGTVVEKLREETLTDRNHLQELLSICQTQRKIGETSLNEISSRSHQILRLTIESSTQEFSPESSATLAASVCFVDLAGSERASQTLSAGSRLKEGCHINRSLLTLGTVIRKLSKGRNGHIPYRDSKLTRILQNSLGGNARTAIICTMSPAHSHLEQSRNTLHFASCAKEVTTNAQVNLVVSEKALVKKLQRELARMENELKNLGPASSSETSEFYTSILKQKEELISKMEEQIQELKWQRDIAQSQIQNLLKSTGEEQSSSSSMENRRRSYDSMDFDEPRVLNLGKSNLYSPDEDGFLLDDTTPHFSEHDLCDKWEVMAQSVIQEPEDTCREVRCIEVNSVEAERIQIHDSLDDTVEKREYEQNYRSFTPNESEKEDADSSLQSVDMDLSLYAELEAEDNLMIKKLVEEGQEVEHTVEKQRQSFKKEDMEQYPSKDQSEELKSPPEEEQCVQVYAGCDKLEPQADELTINELVEDSQVTEHSVEREDKNISWSTNKEDIEQNLSMDQYEKLEKSSPEEEKCVQVYAGSEKTDAQDELTINELVEDSQVTEHSVAIEEKNMSGSSKTEDIEQNLSMNLSEQLNKSPPEEEKCVQVYVGSDRFEAKDELTVHELVEDSQVIEHSVQKEGKNMSGSSKKEDIEQNLSMDQPEQIKKSPPEEEKCVQIYAGSDKFVAKDELTINELVEDSQVTEHSVEKQDKNMSYSSKQEDIEQNLSMDQMEQLNRSPPGEEKCVEMYRESDKDNTTYEALKNKVKELQKTIEYFMSMQSAEEKQPPSLYMIHGNTSPKDYFKVRRSQSCRENLLLTKAAGAVPSGDFIFKTSNTSVDSDNTICSVSIDGRSIKDSDTEISSSRFHEFLEGLKERTMQHHSTERDAETRTMKPENTDDGVQKAEFEKQQTQIIELWEVCNVPLVHRTYFFLLFKGDPSDFVYIEVELRRLSFLKDAPETPRKQTAKALTREREWLAKQIPNKFGKKEREEVYKKWGVELSSKRRSLQVSNKLWINSKDIEHCKESASLVATLVGHIDSNSTPKETFGLSFSPTASNIKSSSGWRFSNPFSPVSFTG